MLKVAITGTNGKTSVAFLASQLMSSCGYKTASLGTLGLISKEYSDPDPILLGTNAVSDIADELEDIYNIDSFFFEAFSVSIEQGMYDNIDVDIAVLTNTGIDGLEYADAQDSHIQASHTQARLKLFSKILNPGKRAVFNHDDALSAQLIKICTRQSIGFLSYGTHKNADVRLTSITNNRAKTEVTIFVGGKPYTIALPFTGEVLIQNWMCAVCVSLMNGLSITQLINTLKKRISPPGQLEALGKNKWGLSRNARPA